MIGKQIRMERIIDRNSKRTIIVPMDHGVTVGPIEGIINMGKTVDQVAEGGANAVIGHVGLPLHGHRKSGKDIGLILHLSASTMYSPDPNNKVIVNSVQNALKMGADGVSIHINIGAESESVMLEQLGSIAIECMEWGMPLLAMMYPRGPSIKDQRDVEAVRLSARVASELGADIVKTVYTGDIQSFRTVVEGCPIPVVIAGGSKGTSEEALGMIHDALEAGAAGVAMGRNCFQHEDPVAFVRAASLIIHKGYGVEKAMKEGGLR